MNFSASEFTRALTGARDALDRLLVHADALAEQGDALGSLISLQASPNKADSLLELELTTKLQRSFGLATRDLQAMSFEWRLGFVDTLTVTAQRSDERNAPALGQVLASPACRFLRHLKIQTTRDASWLAEVPGLDGLELLTRLTCTHGLATFGQVSKRLTRLRHLTLGTTRLKARALKLPLHGLELINDTGGPSPAAADLHALFAAPPWTELEHLKLQDVQLDVTQVLENNPLTSLDLSDAGALEALAQSPHLSKLKKLTIRSFDGLGPLLACRARLAGASLHLVRGTCAPAELNALRASLKQVTWADLHGPVGEGGFAMKLR
ncbi:MAG: hypothetical protein IAE78_21790 [Myxococcus sp.]|nr:hypothetical protein [Myxococcus sp.]